LKATRDQLELLPPDVGPLPLSDDPLGGLTEAQHEAVTYGEGPLLVVAGAGTGKTRVLTRRVAYLIGAERAKPPEILALTFTERAAAEMEERVDLLTPLGQSNVVIRTFHAFGDEIIREFALELGIGADLKVLSAAEQAIFLAQHLFELPLRHYRPLGDPSRHVRSLITLFSRARDEDVSPAEYAEYARRKRAESDRSPEDAGLAEDAEQQEELAATYAAYEQLKLRRGVLDFADQISLCLRIFREHPAAAAKLRSRYRYVLVDEFQDTNHAQLELLKLLCADHRNLSVVGDDDQSIFKWRGAAVSNMLAFRDAYPDARVVTLTENFRSHQPLLDAAYRLIRNNDPDRLEVQLGISKRLWSRRLEGAAVEFRSFATSSEEADGVAERIAAGIAQGRRPGDYAILVRTNRDADPFLQSLGHRGLPYRFSGTAGLYERPEIKLLLSFLYAVARPSDGPQLFLLASSWLYGFPPGDLMKAQEGSYRRNVPLREILAGIAASGEDGPYTAAAVSAAQRLIADLDAFTALSAERTTGEVLYAFLEATGVLAQIAKAESPMAEDEAKNIAKFFSIVRSVGAALPVDRVPYFVDQIGLLIEAGDDPATAEVELSAEVVNVLTVHKAKGLEFSAVFVGACTRGRFPHQQRGDPLELPTALAKDRLPSGDYHEQEERRLFYVAMTRARAQLAFTAARDYGQLRPRRPSPFIAEALGTVAEPALRPEAPAAVLARFAPVEEPNRALPPIPDEEILTISRQALEDYLTCPLRYRYAHALRVPVATPPAAMYGAALHRAVAEYYTRRVAGREVTLEEIQDVFRAVWVAEGFLSAEHAEARLEQGLQTLANFHAREQSNGKLPEFVERPFSFLVGNDRITGRWDRVDREEDGGAVIVDFKSSDVREQRVADDRARGSQQLDVYALAYQRAFGELPKRVELHFLDSGLVGSALKTEDDMAKLRASVTLAGRGIRQRDFRARPSLTACGNCAFSGICPSAVRG
jgi:DNA helicase-2/ATP-dependent DNA helicase PcrA